MHQTWKILVTESYESVKNNSNHDKPKHNKTFDYILWDILTLYASPVQDESAALCVTWCSAVKSKVYVMGLLVVWFVKMFQVAGFLVPFKNYSDVKRTPRHPNSLAAGKFVQYLLSMLKLTLKEMSRYIKGNPLVTGGFPSQRPVRRKVFPCHGVMS